MKKSFFIFVLITGFSFGQNFFNHKDDEEDKETNQIRFFNYEEEEETDEIRFFDYDIEAIDYQSLLEAEIDEEDNSYKAEYEPYSDYSTSLFAPPGGPGNPGYQTPIDNWIFLLPIAGVTVGIYYLRRRKRLEIKE